MCQCNLRVHAARPLNDGVPADRILEWGDEDVGSCRLRRADRFVQVRNQISCTLHTKRIRDRRREAEHRQRADWREDQLHPGAARRRCDRGDAPCAVAPPKVAITLRDETVEILRGHVDVRGVGIAARWPHPPLSLRVHFEPTLGRMAIRSRHQASRVAQSP